MSEWVSLIEAQAMIEVRFPAAPSMFDAAAKAMKDGRISTRGTLLRSKSKLDYVPVLNPGENYPGLIDDNGRALNDSRYDLDTREVNLDDLRSWMARFTSTPAMNAEPANQNSDRDIQAPRRPKGRSYALLDAPLVDQMRQMVVEHTQPSPTAAAWAVIGRDGQGAYGSADPINKVDRLVGRYRELYRD